MWDSLDAINWTRGPDGLFIHNRPSSTLRTRDLRPPPHAPTFLPTPNHHLDGIHIPCEGKTSRPCTSSSIYNVHASFI